MTPRRNGLTGQQRYRLVGAVEKNLPGYRAERLTKTDAARRLSEELGFLVTTGNIDTALEVLGEAWHVGLPRVERTGRGLRGVVSVLVAEHIDLMAAQGKPANPQLIAFLQGESDRALRAGKGVAP